MMASYDDVDDDEQYQLNFTRTFIIILEWTVHAFQFIFCRYCGTFDDFHCIFGQIFIISPPTITVRWPVASCVMDDAFLWKDGQRRKGVRVCVCGGG